MKPLVKAAMPEVGLPDALKDDAVYMNDVYQVNVRVMQVPGWADMTETQKPLVFTESGEPALDYEVLTALCELPAQERAAAIARRAPEIETVIAEQAMGATLVDNEWVIDDAGGTRFPRRLGWFKNTGQMAVPGSYYKPLRDGVRALAAMDKMIERGWGFVPKWNGLDFSTVDAYQHEKRLHVRALYWGTEPERHAAALGLTVALACLIEKEIQAE